MGNINESVRGKLFTGRIYNSPNNYNIVDIRSDGCNRIGVKNFVTGMTATLERVTGYGAMCLMICRLTIGSSSSEHWRI